MENTNRHYINRLTALWAFSESGLGGMMHALKIPFTGFFLGGFAIVILTLIAHHSRNRFSDIMQSTLLVILVKAAASPQSPLMAYFAVGFQGLCAALVFAAGKHVVSSAVFGGLALFESAVQKFITATVFFGKSIWQALDLLVAGIIKELHITSDFSFSMWLIGIYTAVYTVWGIVLGVWANRLPLHMHSDADGLTQRMKDYALRNPPVKTEHNTTGRKVKWKLLTVFFSVLFIASVFVGTRNASHAVFVVMRTVAVLLALYFIVSPLAGMLFRRWLKHKQSGHTHKVKGILDALPQLKLLTAPAMQFARSDHRGIRVYAYFVYNLIVLALYYRSPEHE